MIAKQQKFIEDNDMVRESLSPGEALDANGMAMAVDRTMPSLAS